MALLIAGAACIVAGLWQLVSQASPLTLVSCALTMAANILLLTLSATDADHRARPRARHHGGRLADEVGAQVAAFTTAGTHHVAIR